MFRGIGAPEPFLPRTFEKGAIVWNELLCEMISNELDWITYLSHVRFRIKHSLKIIRNQLVTSVVFAQNRSNQPFSNLYLSAIFITHSNNSSMVKHTQTIRQQIADHFVGLALKGLSSA